MNFEEHKISNINLRVTTFKEFWGDQFNDYIYLFLASKRDLKFDEILNPKTCTNIFINKDEIKKANKICVDLYIKILPKLCKTLNEIHDVRLSLDFWRVAFGYWLYRHICNVYDKYMKLNQIDLESTSLKLLDKSCYYIPQNHEDYIFCFANDFGTEQLVSQYFNINKITKQYIKKNYESTYVKSNLDNNISSYFKNIKIVIKYYIKNCLLKKRKNINIALLGVFFTNKIFKDLIFKSNYKISNINLPITYINKKSVFKDKRSKLSYLLTDNELEKYLSETIIYAIPKDYIENFNFYYKSYDIHLKKNNFKYILSEDWISNIKHSIYIGLAKEKGIKFLAFEHGYGTYFYEFDYDFISYECADKYLTLGWSKPNKNIAKAGFARTNIIPYKYYKNKETILYISRTVLPYEVEIIDRNMVDPHFTYDLSNIYNLIKNIDNKLLDNLLFRPRENKNFAWDITYQLDLLKLNINIDSNNFTKSIHNSRIIIIDHISTALAEIILTGVPFILMYDINKISINPLTKEIFDEMLDCGMLHLNADSTLKQLNTIYDDVNLWWESKSVQSILKKIKEASLSDSNGTINYLLTLI